MSVEFAVIADDFTGALDSSTPFALSGLRVAAATRPEALADALASKAEVIVVNTATRALPAPRAEWIVTQVAEQLKAAAPRHVLKKIDSRLKGNVLAETDAVARAFGFEAMVVAPAVPDQARPTHAGAVTGRGVPIPLPIAPHVAAHAVVADAQSETDLDRLVASHDWSRTLAVGARGLGAAFARTAGPATPRAFEPHRQTLFAIGSRDPITEAQIARLIERHPELDVHDAPRGAFDGTPARLPALIRSTGDFVGPEEAISRSFATAVFRAVESLQPDTLVISGGDTALAILEESDTGVVFPQAEAAPGMPWFLIEPRKRPSIRCVVKSGGFGGSEALADLLPA